MPRSEARRSVRHSITPGDLQRQTQEIMQALEEPIVMPFAEKTSLDDVLK
jgi:hypothetical protein